MLKVEFSAGTEIERAGWTCSGRKSGRRANGVASGEGSDAEDEKDLDAVGCDGRIGVGSLTLGYMS